MCWTCLGHVWAIFGARIKSHSETQISNACVEALQGFRGRSPVDCHLLLEKCSYSHVYCLCCKMIFILVHAQDWNRQSAPLSILIGNIPFLLSSKFSSGKVFGGTSFWFQSAPVRITFAEGIVSRMSKLKLM